VDAGIVDGCSRTGVLLRIVLPVSATGIASSAIISFLWTWNEFIYAFVFTSTSRAQPVTVGCFDAIGDIFVSWNQICAGGTIAALPGILFVLFAQKYLVQGLSAGALKHHILKKPNRIRPGKHPPGRPRRARQPANAGLLCQCGSRGCRSLGDGDLSCG
jgi:ABC-type Fe3+ transport system permease subunit